MKKVGRLAAMLLAVCMLLAPAALAREAAPAQEPMRSVTTGLPTNKEYTPYLIQIDNSGGARPQLGISKADVIYEAEIAAGGATRYSLLFNDELPEEVMSVRSARILHADIALDWNAMFVHWGGQQMPGTDVYEYIAKHSVPHIDGISADRSFFYRTDERISPHNVVVKLREMAQSEKYAYTAEHKAPLRFSESGYTQQGEAVTQLQITYANGYAPGYKYLPEEGLYSRYYKRELQLDESGEEIKVANVIVMYADYSYYNWENDRPVAELTGKNACKFFIDGKYFEGYWTRGSVGEATKYFDAEGAEVLFKPGKTAIHILREGKEIIMQ
ncbi:MAG: DUF3048 domain-containing protein [Eubacteriales bacterium]|nr:DUF3048 domain-containing protein [Eubacteriales bacterium]